MKSKCNCGECKTCRHRVYMREYRKKWERPVWPSAWEESVRQSAEELTKYVCPLAEAVRYGAALVEHSQSLRAAAFAAMPPEGEVC